MATLHIAKVTKNSISSPNDSRILQCIKGLGIIILHVDYKALEGFFDWQISLHSSLLPFLADFTYGKGDKNNIPSPNDSRFLQCTKGLGSIMLHVDYKALEGIFDWQISLHPSLLPFWQISVMNRVEGNSTEKVITKSSWSWSWSWIWNPDRVTVEGWFGFSLCAVPPRSFLHLNLWGVGVKVGVRRNEERECEITKYSRGLRLIELVKLEPSWNRSRSQGRSKSVPRLVSRLVSRLIFELRKYKLNYLFKYSKSMVESGSIVIMEHTWSCAYADNRTFWQGWSNSGQRYHVAVLELTT